jgi:hypothetical protein
VSTLGFWGPIKPSTLFGQRSSTSRAFKLPSRVTCIIMLLHKTEDVGIWATVRVSVICDNAWLKPNTLSA